MPNLIKEDGTRPAGANSYASVADVDAYVETRAYGLTEWTAKSAEDKARCVITATVLIDSFFEFSGYLAAASQVLKWPRIYARNPEGGRLGVRNALANTDGSYFASNEIPPMLVRATCEQALQLAIADRTAPASNEGIRSVKIFQAVEVEFSGNAENSPSITALVQNMLAQIGQYRNSRGGTAKLVRT